MRARAGPRGGGAGSRAERPVLSAVSWGVYDHVPGDGRELVVALGDAVKVRAEDGRSGPGVDISAMIGEWPGGRATAGRGAGGSSSWRWGMPSRSGPRTGGACQGWTSRP